jgi:hypothetical protein
LGRAAERPYETRRRDFLSSAVPEVVVGSATRFCALALFGAQFRSPRPAELRLRPLVIVCAIIVASPSALANVMPGQLKGRAAVQGFSKGATFRGLDHRALNWSAGGVLIEDRHPALCVGADIRGRHAWREPLPLPLCGRNCPARQAAEDARVAHTFNGASNVWSLTQRERFIEATRELECDDDTKGRFEQRLKKITKPKPQRRP